MHMSAEPYLYPPIEPYATGHLPVSGGHEIYYEESGTAEGKPVVFLHGGPGGGTDPKMRRFFDPSRYRIVLFDQRGAGKSRPHAGLNENTTWHLVADIEALRRHLKITRWQVFGGSWGSTLALAYAQSHPDIVDALVLRGIFMLRPQELRWFYQEGASYIFPDAWQDFLQPIPRNEQNDLLRAYYKRLTGDDPKAQLTAAKAWSLWEGRTMMLLQDAQAIRRFTEPQFALAFARIECHYFIHGGFFDDADMLLKNVGRIRHIPAIIIQGRYDVICPTLTAWELHCVWPEADFQIIPDAGHSAMEPAIARALVAATNRLAAI
jgi:proline iminopeptidase